MLALPMLMVAAVSSPGFPDLTCTPLVKGDGFAFHAVRTGYRSPVALPKANPPAKYGRDNPYGTDSVTTEVPWMVTYTDLKTGRMTKLFQGGGWHYRDGSPDIGRGLTTRSVMSLAPAFAADDRHLYLLHLQVKSSSAGGHGSDEVTCTLRTYSGATGRLLATHTVEGYKPDKPSSAHIASLFLGRPVVPDGLTRLDIADGRLTVGKTKFHTVGGELRPVPKQ
jgi:hypothetical protein